MSLWFWRATDVKYFIMHCSMSNPKNPKNYFSANFQNFWFHEECNHKIKKYIKNLKFKICFNYCNLIFYRRAQCQDLCQYRDEIVSPYDYYNSRCSASRYNEDVYGTVQNILSSFLWNISLSEPVLFQKPLFFLLLLYFPAKPLLNVQFFKAVRGRASSSTDDVKHYASVTTTSWDFLVLFILLYLFIFIWERRVQSVVFLVFSAYTVKLVPLVH